MCGFVPKGAVAVEAPRAETVDDLTREELAGQFRLDVCLGHGASPVVYLAREPDSNRHIVVKALPRPAAWPVLRADPHGPPNPRLPVEEEGFS